LADVYIAAPVVSASGSVVPPDSGEFNYMTADEIRAYIKNSVSTRFLGTAVTEQTKSAVRSFTVEKLQYLLTEGLLGSYGAVSVAAAEGVGALSFEFSLPAVPASVAVTAELEIKEGG